MVSKKEGGNELSGHLVFLEVSYNYMGSVTDVERFFYLGSVHFLTLAFLAGVGGGHLFP